MFSIWLWLLNFHMFLKLLVALNLITFQRLLQMTIISYEDCEFRTKEEVLKEIKRLGEILEKEIV